MKVNEKQLLKKIQEEQKAAHDKWDFADIRHIIHQSGIGAKRCEYYLRKWFKRKWYDFGTCIDLGWLTEKGMQVNVDSLPTEPDKIPKITKALRLLIFCGQFIDIPEIWKTINTRNREAPEDNPVVR